MPDHWLCRYGVRLPLYEHADGDAEVLGAAIEVRVGFDGAVVSFSSRWSPTVGHGRLVDAVPAPAEHGDHLRSGERRTGGEIVYLQDSFRASRLLPFHLTTTGHHDGLLPASTHSMLVEILQVPSRSGARLGAEVLGGSGSYRFEWFSWRVDHAPVDAGITEHGRAPVVTVGPGVHHMTVVVDDLRWGTRVEHAALAYVPMPSDVAPAAVPLP